MDNELPNDEINIATRSEKIEFTGIKDTDLLILKELNDKDLFQMCLVNKALNRACRDENFWRERLANKDSSILNYKLPTETWRRFYLKIIHYTSEYSNPNHLLKQACFIGDLSLAVYSIGRGASVITEGDLPLKMASQGHYYDIMKLLIKNGADVNVNTGTILIWNSAYGNLDIVEFLVEHGATVTIDNNLPLRWAATKNKMSIAKYLIDKGANIHAQNEDPLKWFTRNGNFSMVQYLVDLGAIPTTEVMTIAVLTGNLKIVRYLFENGGGVTKELIEQAKYVEIADFLKSKFKA